MNRASTGKFLCFAQNMQKTIILVQRKELLFLLHCLANLSCTGNRKRVAISVVRIPPLETVPTTQNLYEIFRFFFELEALTSKNDFTRSCCMRRSQCKSCVVSCVAKQIKHATLPTVAENQCLITVEHEPLTNCTSSARKARKIQRWQPSRNLPAPAKILMLFRLLTRPCGS